MYSKCLKTSTSKRTSSVIAFTVGFLLQGMVAQADDDQIVASFERSLQERDLSGQTSVVHQAEQDPLYSIVSAALWSVPLKYDNVAASFEYMLSPREVIEHSVVDYQTEPDPLYTMVNAALWNTPSNYDNVAANY